MATPPTIAAAPTTAPAATSQRCLRPLVGVVEPCVRHVPVAAPDAGEVGRVAVGIGRVRVVGVRAAGARHRWEGRSAPASVREQRVEPPAAPSRSGGRQAFFSSIRSITAHSASGTPSGRYGRSSAWARSTAAGCGPSNGTRPEQHLVQGHARGVDVDGRRHPTADRELGRDVSRGAEETCRAGRGVEDDRRAIPKSATRTLRVVRRVQQQVLRLEVAVDDSGRVHGGDDLRGPGS